MLVNADFHVHSCFSMASSKDMLIKNMAPKSKLKGLKLLGTGDAFHPKWLDIIEESTTYSGDGIYTDCDMDFVLTTEVEGKHRIHHLIIIPDIDIARELADKLPSKNKDIDGRPKTNYGGAELLEFVKEYDCLIGPAHAFTPWTGDAHSPWPHRIGREFNQMELEDISFSSIKKAIKHKDIKANYGLIPNLGKYHMTACTKCYKLVDPLIAKENKMKCDCGGTIKKGVDFRISEIADYKEPKHPDFRAEYVHLMPLAEIIATILDKGITTKTVQARWQKLIDNFNTEIDVLINVPLEDIKKVDSAIAPAIGSFRNNSVDVIPGGGGKYGQISFENALKKPEKSKIITLDNF